MKTLVLARHAKSDWNAGRSDFDRPLNERGERDAPRMGKLLAAAGFAPDLILSSPAARARMTAEAVAEKLGYKGEIQLDDRIYESSAGTVLEVIQEVPNSIGSLMVFGHNPTTEMLASFLLQTHNAVTVPTCGMICFDSYVGSWSQFGPRGLTLKWFLIPKMIS